MKTSDLIRRSARPSHSPPCDAASDSDPTYPQGSVDMWGTERTERASTTGAAMFHVKHSGAIGSGGRGMVRVKSLDQIPGGPGPPFRQTRPHGPRNPPRQPAGRALSVGSRELPGGWGKLPRRNCSGRRGHAAEIGGKPLHRAAPVAEKVRASRTPLRVTVARRPSAHRLPNGSRGAPGRSRSGPRW